MALVEAARFHTLSEAEVAASVLRSAGIDAVIADVHYGSVFWVQQSALGGYRLSVIDEDLADALALLDAPTPEPEVDDETDEPIPTGRRVAAGMLSLWPEAGWLVTRRGSGVAGPAALVAIGGGVIVFVLLVVLRGLFGGP
jgi:hypothetical protein